MSNNRTTDYLNQELKKERIAEKEINNIIQSSSIIKIMNNVEDKRQELYKKSSLYTQEYVAKKAGISLVTYWNYKTGRSNGTKWITIENLAHVLKCDVLDIIKPSKNIEY